MQIQDDYRVSLDAFQGPLDLLLFLIRRAEVDVHDIPVAAITDQYLAFLREVDEVDVELAGEFLVMAATLIELKSRTLMPPEEREAGERERRAEEQEDPRYALVQQLLAYQRFRVASEELEDQRHAFWSRHRLRPGRPAWETDETERDLELDDAHPMDLADAYERIMSSIDLSRLGDHLVEIDDTPIKLHEEDLLDRLTRAGDRRLTLQSAFEGRSGGQRVGLFLATLELARQHRVLVQQDDIDEEILLILRDDQDGALHIEYDGLDEDQPAASAAEPSSGTSSGAGDSA